MKELKRNVPELDFIRLTQASPRLSSMAAYSGPALEEFGRELAGAADSFVQQPERLAGIRAEVLFRVVIMGIGSVQLLKEEDDGAVAYNGDEVAVPDYRLVLEDGRHLLVEVKRHEIAGDLNREFAISDRRVRALRRYAELTGAELRFAIFWEGLRKWTLCDLRAFTPGQNGERQWRIPFPRAYATNSMRDLGDYLVVIPAPLKLRIVADPSADNPVQDAYGEKQATFTIERVELLADDFILKGVSAKIAWRLLWYGDWHDWPLELKEEAGQLVYVEFPVGPPVADGSTGRLGSHPVGALSDMISRCYLQGAAATVHTTSRSEVLRPGYMGKEFIPDNWTELSLDMPIAKFHVRPNYDFEE